MKKRVLSALIAAAMILPVSGCGLESMSFNSKSESTSAGVTTSANEVNDNSSKDPDKAKSLKEYVELRFGPIANDFNADVYEEDDKSWGILEDKEYGFQYRISLDKGADYKDCKTNFANQYKGYIHAEEDTAIDAINDESGVSVEFNFLESEFIIAELVLNDPSRAPELTEKIGKIFEKYDNRHFFDRYLVVAKKTDGDLIGTYLIWHEYEAED